MKRLILILILLGIAVAVFAATRRDIQSDEPQLAPMSPVSGFEWSSQSKDMDEKGIVWTDVYLMVAHADGTNEKKYIASVQGSCNDIDADEPLALGSSVFQCYAAGFGDKFRVMDSGDAYLLQRQEFQEATPDDTSPLPEFKTILTINK
jgi:hypothetical protein